MIALWDYLLLSELKWHNPHDVVLYVKKRDEFRVYQFTITLNEEFELVWSSLFYRDTFPNLDIVVTKLCVEEVLTSLVVLDLNLSIWPLFYYGLSRYHLLRPNVWGKPLCLTKTYTYKFNIRLPLS